MKILVVIVVSVILITANPVFGASYFVEDFSGGVLPANFENQLAAGSSIDYSGGSAEWGVSDGRGYIRTIESGYHSVDFVFEATVDIKDGASPNGVGFLGMGTGVPDGNGSAAPWAIPSIPNVHAEVAPDGFAGGFIGYNDNQSRVSGLLGRYEGWDGVHRVRLSWTASTQTALYECDKDYDGGAFVSDHSWTINGADNGFNATNSHLFVGGGEGVIWDDIVVYANTNLTILSHPTDVAASIGDTAGFSIVADNADSYSWYKEEDANSLTDGAKYLGTTTASLAINNVQLSDEGGYYCVVADDHDSIESLHGQLLIARLIEEGVQLHLEADAGVTVNARNLVLEWADISGNGNHVDPNDMGNAPMYVADGMRGKLPSLDFDGVNDYLTGGGNTLNITNDHTIFLIVDTYQKNLAAYFAIQGGEGATGIVCYQGNRPNVRYIVKASGVWTQDYTGDSNAGWQDGVGFQMTCRRAGVNMVLRANGNQIGADTGTAGPVAFTDTSELMVGIQQAPTSYEYCHKGSISAILVYNRALDDLEVKVVEAYLLDKWIVPYDGETPQIYSIADMNQDGVVNLFDWAMLAVDWLD